VAKVGDGEDDLMASEEKVLISLISLFNEVIKKISDWVASKTVLRQKGTLGN